MLLQLVLFGLLTVPIASQAGVEYFASMRLCNHFGGQCGYICPHRFIRHKWNIPLCPSWDVECCIGPPPTEPAIAEPEEESLPTTTLASPTTTTTTTSSEAAAYRPQPEAVCGVVTPSSRRRKRIVGGSISSPGRWPWLVALRSVLGSHTCAGAVIHPRWILTAAHCFKHISTPSLWRVRVSEYDLLNHDTGERDLLLDSIIMHSGYRSSTGQATENQTLYARYVNDIALVRLGEDAGTTPICLPPEEGDSTTGSSQDASSEGAQPSESAQSAYGQCWVAGWGITMDSVVDDQLLRDVSGEVIDSQQCSQMWGTRLEDDMICFGNGTFGPCTGDSGGPLSCERDGHFFLEGVVSWGTEDCTRNGYPSVFTRVRSFLPWINSQMNPGASDE